jgi:hypothetical protein
MRSAPSDLGPDEVAAAVAAHWPIHPTAVEHAPIGFGSHHWHLTDRDGVRWFVTGDAVADDPERLHRLTAAITTTYALRHRAGLSFVAAPVLRSDGRLLAVRGRYALAVYPHLEQVDDRPLEPDEMVAMLAALHATAPPVEPPAPVDDLRVDHRERLEAVLADPATIPGNGPYARCYVELITAYAGPIRAAWDRFDLLAGRVRASAEPWVITHGEPKRNNVLITADGPMLIDWDTVRVGPPARDLWMAGAVDRYQQVTGRRIADDHLAFYRLRWDLADLCSYGRWFTDDHDRTADTELGWQGCEAITRRLAAEPG